MVSATGSRSDAGAGGCDNGAQSFIHLVAAEVGAGNVIGCADFGLSGHFGLLGQGVYSSLSARSTLSA